MARKIRSDCTIESFAKKNGLPEEIFKNADGRKTRKDKTFGAMRKEFEKAQKR